MTVETRARANQAAAEIKEGEGGEQHRKFVSNGQPSRNLTALETSV